MATQKPTLSIPVLDFLAALLGENSVNQRAEIIASYMEPFFSGSAIAIYRYDPQNQSWLLAASSGDAKPENSVSRGGVLGSAAELSGPTVWSGARLRLEQYAHLGLARHVESLACVPLVHGSSLVAVIEIASFDRPVEEREFAALSDVLEHSAVALASATAYESERNSNYDSITRLTQLYDLERTFNSTLEMEKLLNIVPAKIREILPCSAINLWMVQDDDVTLVGRSGNDPSTELGEVQKKDQGVAAHVAETGKPAAILDPKDARLQARKSVSGASLRSLLAVPIIDQEFLVGVIEAVDRADGLPFNEDDLFFLTTISQTTASALHNASLLEAERKVEILETLVDVSREITSTLNLDRVLQAVVNGPQRIMEYDRAAIALETMGKLQVKAISGKTEIVAAEPAVKALLERLQFCAVSDADTYVVARNGVVETDDEETRSQFTRYFKQTGSRAWYCVPLTDDQGRLGVLSFESKNPDFLASAHLELIKVLAAQATVALRNASMYTETPFIGMLEPLQKRKRQFMSMDKGRRATWIAAAAVVLLFLIFFPIPMRVAGTALVAPQRKAAIQAPFDGVVRRVLVHEGDTIRNGDVLAELEDWEYRSAIATAQARREEALAKMNHALAVNDGAEAGVQRVESEYWTSQLALERERLEHTRLRSPVAGVISTPHIEDATGRKLQLGDLFAEVVDTSRASVDVAVDQEDVPLLRAGEPVAIKLDGFPTRKFQGTVAIVAPVASVAGDERVFMARVEVPNNDGVIRAGMQGNGKVSIGWRSAGYVMFRGIGMWAWTKLWNWFGW
jgi:RND family efflux transporter MFP subunit